MANILEFSGLLQTTTSSFLRKRNQLILATNCHGDEIGSLQQRLGYTQYGNDVSAGNAVNGLHSYPYIAGGTENLFGYANGTLRYNNAGVWTDIQGGLLANAKPEFRVFLDQLFMVGSDGTNFLTTAVITGTGYSIAGNVTGAPTGNYIEIFRDRVYITRGSDFYYSSIPAANVITWNTADDVEPVYTTNGENLMGIHNNKSLNQLLLFKKSSLHTWDTARLNDVGNVGTTAHRSIATVDYITFFYNGERKKIYAYKGYQPKWISRGIDKWVKGIQNPSSVFGTDSENQFYKLYVGTCVVDGVSYSNCEFRYSMPDNTWTVYQYYDSFTTYTKHNVSDIGRVYAGTSDGECHQLAIEGDEVYADDGHEINSQFIFETDMGVPSERKKINQMLVYTTRAQNLTGRVRVRGGDWSTHFAINESEQSQAINPADGRFMQFHFSSSSTSMPWKFEGIEFLPVLTTKEYK